MPTYSNAQRKYWAQRPANVLKFDTVDFSHPDNGNIRLVANQFSDKTLNGDTYQAVAMEFPQITNQTTGIYSVWAYRHAGSPMAISYNTIRRNKIPYHCNATTI